MRTVKTIIASCKKLYIEIIWLRDEGLCQWCHGEKGPAEQVHHIIERSLSAYLFYDLLNLILLCKKCHCKYGHDKAAGIYWFEHAFPARWEYIHSPICDEMGRKMPRRNIIKRSWKKQDYLEIEIVLKENLTELKG